MTALPQAGVAAPTVRTRSEPDGGGVPFAAARLTPEARPAPSGCSVPGGSPPVPRSPRSRASSRSWSAPGTRSPSAPARAGSSLSLRALDCRRAPGCCVSAVTFVGALHAIVHSGLTPGAGRRRPGHRDADAETTAAAARRGGGAAGMMRRPSVRRRRPRCRSLRRQPGLPLGRRGRGRRARARYRGRRTAASAACPARASFSFYATKNLPIGEGGMVSTDDAGLAGTLRRTRLHGMSHDAWRRYLPGGGWRYDVDRPGLKANMTDLQAAIGRGQLHRVPAGGSAAGRRSRPGTTRSWPGCPGSRLRTGPPAVATPGTSTRSGSGLSAALHRDELSGRLAERGIGTSVHFVPLHHLSYCSALTGLRPGELPGADLVAGQLLSLPLHPWLSERRRRSGVRAAARPTGWPGAAGPDGEGGTWRPTHDGPICVRVIVGAGEAGRAIGRDLGGVPEYGLDPIGFLDDTRASAGSPACRCSARWTTSATCCATTGRTSWSIAIPALPPRAGAPAGGDRLGLGRHRPLPALVRRRAGAGRADQRPEIAEHVPPDRAGRGARGQRRGAGGGRRQAGAGHRCGRLDRRRAVPAGGQLRPGEALHARPRRVQPARPPAADVRPGAAGRRRHHHRRRPGRPRGWTRSSPSAGRRSSSTPPRSSTCRCSSSTPARA